MTESTTSPHPMEHGEQCSCKLLAQALGLDPRALTFEYCHRVLHQHWRMTCRHGRPTNLPATIAISDRWRSVGPIDPVKAILLSNDEVSERPCPAQE